MAAVTLIDNDSVTQTASSKTWAGVSLKVGDIIIMYYAILYAQSISVFTYGGAGNLTVLKAVDRNGTQIYGCGLLALQCTVSGSNDIVLTASSGDLCAVWGAFRGLDVSTASDDNSGEDVGNTVTSRTFNLTAPANGLNILAFTDHAVFPPPIVAANDAVSLGTWGDFPGTTDSQGILTYALGTGLQVDMTMTGLPSGATQEQWFGYTFSPLPPSGGVRWFL